MSSSFAYYGPNKVNDSIIDRLYSSILAVDTEVSQKGNGIIGLAIAFSPDEALFFTPNSPMIGKVKEALLGTLVVFHNALFDLKWLKTMGIEVTNFSDTLLCASNEGKAEFNLPYLSLSNLHEEVKPISSFFTKKGMKVDDLPIEQVAQACCSHAIATYNLWQYYQTKDMPLLNTLDVPFLYLVKKMGENGVAIDQGEVQIQSVKLQLRELDLKLKLGGMIGPLNYSSTKQLREALLAKGIITHLRTEKGKNSVNEEALLEVRHQAPELIDAILEYRGIKKTITTYIPMFEGHQRVHSSFGITRTGRLTSSEPNMQNITRGELRKIVTAEPGNILVVADYEQLEARLIAALSQDHNMIDAYQKGRDLHQETKDYLKSKYNVEIDRYTAKNGINFPLWYGAGAYQVKKTTGMCEEECLEFLEWFFNRFPGTRRWVSRVRKELQEKGYVTTYFGRKRYIPEISSGSRKEREHGYKAGVNTIPQGTGADIVKQGMLFLQEQLTEEDRIVLQVHDEVLVETTKERGGIVKGLCEKYLPWFSIEGVDFPIKVKTGANWHELV